MWTDATYVVEKFKPGIHPNNNLHFVKPESWFNSAEGMPACSVRVSGCKRARTHARMTCRNLCYGQTRSRCWSKRDGASSKLRWTSRTSCLELCCRPIGSYLLASEVHEGAYNRHASKAHKDDINSDLFVFLHREQRRE